MDSQGVAPVGCAAFAIRVEFERNSRSTNIKAKAASWYTGHEGESPDEAAAKTVTVQANATAIAMLAAQAVETKLERGFDAAQVQAFIEHVEAFAERLAQAPLP